MSGRITRRRPGNPPYRGFTEHVLFLDGLLVLGISVLAAPDLLKTQTKTQKLRV